MRGRHWAASPGQSDVPGPQGTSWGPPLRRTAPRSPVFANPAGYHPDADQHRQNHPLHFSCNSCLLSLLLYNQDREGFLGFSQYLGTRSLNL